MHKHTLTNTHERTHAPAHPRTNAPTHMNDWMSFQHVPATLCTSPSHAFIFIVTVIFVIVFVIFIIVVPLDIAKQHRRRRFRRCFSLFHRRVADVDPTPLLPPQICKNFLYGGGTMVWHKEHKAPYIFSGYTWVGYDDRYSLQLKVGQCRHLHHTRVTDR